MMGTKGRRTLGIKYEYNFELKPILSMLGARNFAKDYRQSALRISFYLGRFEYGLCIN